MARLAGKNTIVTGGSSGIGFATAQAFLEEGARVMITGLDETRLADARKRLGPSVLAVRADMREDADLTKVAAEAKQAFGEVDVLFLNAGVTVLGPLAHETPRAFDDQMATNVRGPFFLVQRVAPLLREAASVVVNTSCLNELGMPGMAAYAASKAALRSLTRTLAAELISRKIRVNAVSPGPVETPIYGKLGLPGEAVQQMAQTIQAKLPIGRFAKPEEIARTVVFLASSDSSFMVGEEIVVDGGWTTL